MPFTFYQTIHCATAGRRRLNRVGADDEPAPTEHGISGDTKYGTEELKIATDCRRATAGRTRKYRPRQWASEPQQGNDLVQPTLPE